MCVNALGMSGSVCSVGRRLVEYILQALKIPEGIAASYLLGTQVSSLCFQP